MSKSLVLVLPIYLLGLLFAQLLFADPSTDARQKTSVIIHISSSKQNIQQAALNNAQALLNHYGDKRLNLEIVANGPGIGLVNSQNRFTREIQQLIGKGVIFSACNITLNKLLKNNQPINIVEGVGITPSGVVRVTELQKQGYYYVHL